MPSHGNRTGRDTLDAMLQRISDLEAQVHDLQGGRRVSMDRGDANSLTVDKGAFEGQTLIQYADSSPYVAEGAYYFSNGEWRPFTTGGTLQHQDASYIMPGGGSTTVPSTGSGALLWTLEDGDAILDVSSPATPAIIQAGLYTVDIVYSSTTAVWTVGACIQGVLQFHLGAWAGTWVKDSRSKVPTGAQNLPAGGDNDVPRGECHLTSWMEPGDQITFQIDNLDSGTRDLTVDSAAVSLLYI